MSDMSLKKQVEPWLAITRRFMEDLKDEPVTISMNPWTNLLHSDRGRHLTEDFKFRMRDYAFSRRQRDFI